MKNYVFRQKLLRTVLSYAMVSIQSLVFVYQANVAIPNAKEVTQMRKISGKVVDSNGIPVIGANVIKKGSDSGTITDIDGNFVLDGTFNGVLVISFIGYKTQEISLNNNTDLSNIILREDAEMLDEVVVVGYGSQTKASLTGAVTVVGSEKLEGKGTLASPLQAMQGTVPGVIVTRSSGAPGEEGWNMKLRGAISTNSTDPLIIIDGVEFSDGVNGMRNINPNDIETINFLKDASAAIYGAKAAGGVVLITTKKGISGKTNIQYSGTVTGKVVGLQPELMSLDQWADAIISAQTNDGLKDSKWIRYAKLAKQYKGKYIDLDYNPSPFADGDFVGPLDFCFIENDWQDLLWGNATSTQHELAISGGTDKSSYRLSLGYMYDGSNLQYGNNSKQRYNLRLSNVFKLTNKTQLESIIAYSRENQVKPSLIQYVLSASVPQPGLPSSTIDGKQYSWGNWKAPNWLAELGGDDKLNVYNVNISENFNWNITKSLDLVVQLGYNSGLAIRDKQENSIDWYNYSGTKIAWTEPTQENSKYTKSYANTDFYLLSSYISVPLKWDELNN